MPWVKQAEPPSGLKGRENLGWIEPRTVSRAPAALQAAWFVVLSPQGIGLRPQPWAALSRPVGPVLIKNEVQAERLEDVVRRGSA
jgi:hypothetical protein